MKAIAKSNGSSFESESVMFCSLKLVMKKSLLMGAKSLLKRFRLTSLLMEVRSLFKRFRSSK